LMERWGERQGNALKAAEPRPQVLEVHLPSAAADDALAMSQIHFSMCGKACSSCDRLGRIFAKPSDASHYSGNNKFKTVTTRRAG
jgi:hypothetical protein